MAVIKVTHSFTLIDSLGRNVTIYHYPPTKVVALTPALSETVCVMNCSKLIGTVEPVTWPPQLVKMVKEGKVKLVGQFWMPNLEKIASLKPDLILADEGADLRMINQLKELKVPVLFVRGGMCTTVACVENDIELVGKAIGEINASKIIVKNITLNIEKASKVAKKYPTVKVLMLLYPYRWGVYAVSKNTFIGDIVSKLNAINLIKTKAGWPRVAREFLVTVKPDVVVVIGGEKLNPKVAVKDTKALGVKAKWICVIYGNYTDVVQRPGPRLSEAPWVLLKAIHLHVTDLKNGLYCSSG